MWILENKTNPSERICLEFPSKEAAQSYHTRMGRVIASHYTLKFESGNPLQDRMLTEGMVKGDLYKILLPRVSVDEFVPGDPETDNIVIAFFLKGVPEATLPFKTFAEKCNGVLQADYGDSETVVGAQNVYVEFDRENLEMEDIHALMIQASMLAGLEDEDFTMTFPHTDQKFPYDIDLMKEYFDSRNEKMNRIAQQRALDKAKKEFEKELEQARQKQAAQGEDPNAVDDSAQALSQASLDAPGDTGTASIDDELESAQESIIDFMTRVPLRG